MRINIIEFLPVGIENAVSMEELSARTGKTQREIRAAILEARRKGVPVCSAEQGYWIARTADEATRYYRRQLARIITGFVALKPIKRFIVNEGAREDWEALEALERKIEKAAHGVDDIP
ncbi:MAG: hypothetical protein IJ784_01350 [Ruminiclostridium sp.]|uniref:hypothetical protein n=1 Tax=Ruminococcus sp. TaxID=41978 RepID=UPI0025E96987|nr:hypothetical protein [Ruminococcus sp.]MBR1433031.1 hypothetical protein [Ruminococcus sp.]MBR1831062.1 hypothetical protein [Ruminiclostridium sp.]